MPTNHIQGIVEKLVFGGDGLIRKDGFVIFVPGVVPGEEVIVEIVSRKKNFAKARLVDIVQKSPHRIAPRCRHFGTCGGCQLQHISYSMHAEIKKNWIKEAFFPLFDKEIQFVSPNDTFFWRRKIILHACMKEGNWRVGYFGLDNKTIIEIDECLLFFEERETFRSLKNLLPLIIAEEGSQLDVEVFKLPDGSFALKIHVPFSLRKDLRGPLLAKMKQSVFKKFSLQFSSWTYSEGGFFEPISFQALETPYYFSLQAFIQNHRTLGERLWHDVVEVVDGLQEKQTILDLYAGVGVTAIALGKRGHDVIAIEGNKEAVHCAEKTCSGVTLKPTFLSGSVEKSIPALAQKANTWVMNPPRTGISKDMLQLTCTHKPEHIIYISCSPATLARDVKELIRAGWSLQSLRGYDMFPQTTHLETVAELSRLSP